MFEWLGPVFQGLLLLVGFAIAIAVIVSLFNKSRGGGAGTNLNDLLDIQARLLDVRDEVARLRRMEPNKVRMLSQERARFELALQQAEGMEMMLTREINAKERRLQELGRELPPEDVDAQPRVILREWLERKVV